MWTQVLALLPYYQRWPILFFNENFSIRQRFTTYLILLNDSVIASGFGLPAWLKNRFLKSKFPASAYRNRALEAATVCIKSDGASVMQNFGLKTTSRMVTGSSKLTKIWGFTDCDSQYSIVRDSHILKCCQGSENPSFIWFWFQKFKFYRWYR